MKCIYFIIILCICNTCLCACFCLKHDICITRMELIDWGILWFKHSSIVVFHGLCIDRMVDFQSESKFSENLRLSACLFPETFQTLPLIFFIAFDLSLKVVKFSA